jgi:hypothetical protein
MLKIKEQAEKKQPEAALFLPALPQQVSDDRF